MKSMYIAVAVAVVLLGAAIGYSIYVQNIAHSLEEHTSNICDEVRAENFEAAIEAAHKLESELERKKTLLGVMVDHKDVYEIRRSLDEMFCYLENEEKNDSLAHCAAISAMTERIAENSLPYIFNIL